MDQAEDLSAQTDTDSSAAPDEGVEQSKAPLIEHLIELRQRLIYAIVGTLVAFVFCYLVADDIYAFLVQPLADAFEGQENRRMIYTALYEAFFVKLKVAFFAAICVAFPIIASQIWMFVAPGLYRHEKKAFLPFLVATPVLFTIGAGLVYAIVMPLAWRFFLGFEQDGLNGGLPIQLEAKIGEYLALVMKLMLAFGISFQLPVLLMLLARAGMIGADWLARQRKYAIVIAFAFAAVITPPDFISQILLGIPIVLLYEISIWAIRLTERRRQSEASEGDPPDSPPTSPPSGDGPAPSPGPGTSGPAADPKAADQPEPQDEMADNEEISRVIDEIGHSTSAAGFEDPDQPDTGKPTKKTKDDD